MLKYEVYCTKSLVLQICTTCTLISNLSLAAVERLGIKIQIPGHKF